MNKTKWKSLIIQACKDSGTYKPFFDAVIDTMAQIMEMRDTAIKNYEKEGGAPVVEHTNTRGVTNLIRNPALAVVLDLNNQGLAFWRELGLTPAAYRRISAEALKDMPEQRGLETIIAKLEALDD